MTPGQTRGSAARVNGFPCVTETHRTKDVVGRGAIAMEGVRVEIAHDNRWQQRVRRTAKEFLGLSQLDEGLRFLLKMCADESKGLRARRDIY